ncbi:hypothetical protein [Streptomyces sp. CC219B]|uniref:hypothetical protein n=1 Tax=Streptomyces sp. CC219B TaxID=3044574 RepID=UPI0032BF2E21
MTGTAAVPGIPAAAERGSRGRGQAVTGGEGGEGAATVEPGSLVHSVIGSERTVERCFCSRFQPELSGDGSRADPMTRVPAQAVVDHAARRQPVSR